MNPAQLDHNADYIDRELTWFSQILEHRFQLRAEGKKAESDLFDLIPPPELPQTDVPYAELVQKFNLQPAERLVLILSLIPLIQNKMSLPCHKSFFNCLGVRFYSMVTTFLLIDDGFWTILCLIDFDADLNSNHRLLFHSRDFTPGSNIDSVSFLSITIAFRVRKVGVASAFLQRRILSEFSLIIYRQYLKFLLLEKNINFQV